MTKKDVAFVEALLTTGTLAAAARAAGVSERTARRMRQRPEMAAALAAARRDLLGGTVTRLVRTSRTAAAALARNCRCGTPAVEVAAARAVLDLVVRVVEQADLEARVAALEAAAAGDEDEEAEPAWH